MPITELDEIVVRAGPGRTAADLGAQDRRPIDELMPRGQTLPIRLGELAALSRVATATRALGLISNSATETSVFSETVPGGLMGPSGIVRCRWFGRYDNSSTAGRQLRVRINFGGVLIYNDITQNLSQTQGLHSIELNFEIANLASVSSNIMYGYARIQEMDPADTGFGNITGGTAYESNAQIGSAVLTTDTDQDQTIEITMQLSDGEATQTVDRDTAYLQLL